MKEQITWEEIKNRYPDQWVRLENVQWEKGNNATIKSAVVRKAGSLADQDLIDAAQGKCFVCFTTPENHLSVGMAFV